MISTFLSLSSDPPSVFDREPSASNGVASCKLGWLLLGGAALLLGAEGMS